MPERRDVPDVVRRGALAHGVAGARWLRALDGVLRDLERDWGITLGPSLGGGTASYVAEATTADGTAAVVKVALPAEIEAAGDFDHEVRTLELASGRGCARALLAHDAARRSLLLERLGRPLVDLRLPIATQLEIICETVRPLWECPHDGAGLPSGAEKGRWLADFIPRTWEDAGRPCSERVVERALSFAERRIERFDPETAVLVHGDAHQWNTLEERVGSDRFVLVDPDGIIGDREYDLAISMREHSEELLAGDAVRIGVERCNFLSRLTGTGAAAIWEWGYVERVSSGVLCAMEGHEQWAREGLEVAERWVDVEW